MNSPASPLRIGNASGFYGDRFAAVREMLTDGREEIAEARERIADELDRRFGERNEIAQELERAAKELEDTDTTGR